MNAMPDPDVLASAGATTRLRESCSHFKSTADRAFRLQRIHASEGLSTGSGKSAAAQFASLFPPPPRKEFAFDGRPIIALRGDAGFRFRKGSLDAPQRMRLRPHRTWDKVHGLSLGGPEKPFGFRRLFRHVNRFNVAGIL